jgi:spermidine synthase
MTGSDNTTSAPFRLSILHDAETDMGRVMLRKRWSLALERDVFEMTMDGKLMMSNAVVESERALAERAPALVPNVELKVLIGGLGFGFTAQATLADSRVRKLTVVERLGLVIQWHREGLLPWSGEFISDPRLKILQGDFFAIVAGWT